MLCQIYDNWIDGEYLHSLARLIESIDSLSFDNIANRKSWPYGQKGSHRLMGSTIFSRSGLNRVEVLHPKASKFFDIFESIEDLSQRKYFLSQINKFQRLEFHLMSLLYILLKFYIFLSLSSSIS